MSLTREQLLSKPTNPFEPRAGASAADILERMADTAFQGRQLGQAFQVWRDMLADPDCTILMGMSGAMTPAGMRRLVRFMIENRLIDVLTSTGANFFHDIHETQGFFHYQGSPTLDDEMLGEQLVDRVYDVLADEEQFREHDRWVGRFAGGLEQRAYTTREFLYLLGTDLGARAKDHGIVSTAAKENFPLFCPAIADSSIGIGLAQGLYHGEHSITMDMAKDVLEIASIVAASKQTGVIYFGGGTPKNYTQQTEIVAILMNQATGGHKYGVQVVTDSPQWGGLSGCTLEESQSWGKIQKGASMVNCHCDSTIAMPLIVSALAEQTDLIAERKKRAPRYDMGREFGVTFP